jgi:inorganic pyrophosphatase
MRTAEHVTGRSGDNAAAMAENGDEDDPLLCFVEIPKGSRNKYEWDDETGAIMLDRFLFSSMVYPTDYGFIPDTLGQDGDALDAMVCVSEATFPGCVIPVKPIALFRMEDDQGIDDKVLCVPLSDPAWNTLENLDDLPKQLQQEIEHFFSVYKDLEQKKVKVDGWHSREEAMEEIEEARKRKQGGGEDQEADAKEGESKPDSEDESSGEAEEPAKS